MKKVAFSKLSTNALGLKRLPIPPLADTLKRYRASVTPLKKEASVNSHFDKLKLFEDTSAQAIQQELLDSDATNAKNGTYPNSYIEKTWDDGYLAFRGPLAINIAPSISMKKLPNVTGQAETAAAYVHGILRFIKKMTEDGVDVKEGKLTDVSQFQNQFSFARVPEADRDVLHQADVTKATTITAMCKGQMYTVKVVDDDGCAYSEQVIAQSLRNVVSAAEKDSGPTISYLTACGRSDWATSYSDLIAGDPVNKELLNAVHDSLIVVCLDQKAWGKENTMKLEAMLYGGSELSNRWYDKHQLIVDQDGSAAMCFEHSFSDGMTWSRWLQEVHSSLSGVQSGFSSLPTLQLSAEASPESDKLVRHLAFQSGKSFGSRIRTAEQELQKLTRGVLLDEVTLPFGKDKLKSLGVSPDAFCQMAMHWSYYQMRHKLAPTYESCSTGGFWHGRTETIRSATSEMRELITLLEKLDAETGAIKNLSTENGTVINQMIHATADRHSQLAREASQGLGVDRHLLSLKEIVKNKKDINGLSFFNDELFPYSGTWVMSTSNLSLPYVDSFNFGPVTPHGLGIGYSVQADSISLTVSSFRTSSKTKIRDFCQLMKKSSSDLVCVLQRTNKGNKTQ